MPSRRPTPPPGPPGIPARARLRLPGRLARRPARLVCALLLVCVIVVVLGQGAAEQGAVRGSVRGATTLLRWRGEGVLRFVDPLIGTANGGHVFPGATIPYGMAKPGPDTDSRGENAAGFISDNNPILGFSQLHDSGTGGSASLGNFPIFMHPGCTDDLIANCAFSPRLRQTPRVAGSVRARPGFFSIALANGVHASMTATAHAALFRFATPPGPAVTHAATRLAVPHRPVLLLDVQDLAGTRRSGAVAVDPASGRISGGATFRPSFGSGSFVAYVCADVAGPLRDVGVFKADEPLADALEIDPLVTHASGAYVRFAEPSAPIFVRVGTSFLSVAQACRNAEREIPDFGNGQRAFDAVLRAAEAAWTEKLAPITVDARGVDDELQTVFWSGLYRTMLSPQNYTGENPLWLDDGNGTGTDEQDDKDKFKLAKDDGARVAAAQRHEPYFDSFYCIWDSFRAQHPLLTILDPVAQAQMVRTLLDVYKHEGWLPDCRMSFSKGYTQGGSNADVVIADSLIKNISHGIDWPLALAAVLADADAPPPSFDLGGRGNIAAWRELGYVPADDRDTRAMGRNTRSVSRTLEYAYDDFAIATLARALGRPPRAWQPFLARSANWRHVWNAAQPDFAFDAADGDDARAGRQPASPFVGFPQPRLRNGSFAHQNTRTCSPRGDMHRCYLDTRLSTYEGSPWLYSFYAPHDMDGLAGVMGGRRQLVQRLEYYHESGIAYMGNEQAFLTVFQFHYGGRPGLSSKWARAYVPSQFNTTVGGLPGNDDCAMGAFTGMAMMGFFPVAGQDVYLIIPPFFRQVRIRAQSDTGAHSPPRDAVIRKVGAHANDPLAIYVTRARYNGREYRRNWLTHRFFVDGGVLELEVSRDEGSWGTADEDLPPSYPGRTEMP